MKYLTLALLLLNASCLFGQKADLQTKFEISNKTETVTYEEGIAFYQKLADQFSQISITPVGMTDAGKPLHMVVYSADAEFDIDKLRMQGKPIFLINNAIHPGEPDGVDASMMLLRDLVTGKALKKERKEFVLVIIPFYNIGGVLNRNSTTRVNQKGPSAYGFRGNARNYDLNRDFIKGDTRNATAFWEIFRKTDPDFFLDTHVSNGADYQYTMTLIATQEQKMSQPLQKIMREVINPALFTHMEKAGDPMTPYVNAHGTTPDNGINEFADWPRYSTGYASLFNTYSFMSETHMLKPFGRRVASTYQLMVGMAKTLVDNKSKVLESRAEAKELVKTKEDFAIKWSLDKDFSRELSFKGYEASYIPSRLTSQKRLYYDHSKPFEKNIKFKNRYKPVITVKKPDAYIVQQGWVNVVERLKRNGVQMKPLAADTAMLVEVYRIKNYKTVQSPYEGHYYHYGIELEQSSELVALRKGDFIIKCDQEVNRFVIETLEPLAEDSYFKWNMFDTVLGSKEGFSSYVFEELAEEVLNNDPELMKAYREKQQNDADFAGNRYQQLKWIYDRSKYKEKEHLRYPVFKIN